MKKKKKNSPFLSCYIFFTQWSLDNELRSIKAWGTKLLHSLLVWQQILP